MITLVLVLPRSIENCSRSLTLAKQMNLVSLELAQLTFPLVTAGHDIQISREKQTFRIRCLVFLVVHKLSRGINDETDEKNDLPGVTPRQTFRLT